MLLLSQWSATKHYHTIIINITLYNKNQQKLQTNKCWLNKLKIQTSFCNLLFNPTMTVTSSIIITVIVSVQVTSWVEP